MPRHEYAEICLISATGAPNQCIAAGCTAVAIQRSSSETIGHASVAGGLTATGVIPVICSPLEALGAVTPAASDRRPCSPAPSPCTVPSPSTSRRRSYGTGERSLRGEADPFGGGSGDAVTP